ncbi:MAG: MBL fold metallo-hydrolase, partial [Clostridium sp.]|nr:MBL fold metallo-hydrolase [Clostridium sp.]
MDEIASSGSLGEFDRDLLTPICPDVDFTLGDLNVRPFKIDHDAANPVAYRVNCGDKSVAVATDMGHFDQYIIDNLQGLDALLLESNHDVRMLETGPYPYYLKRRILGDHGHLSNENAGRLLNCVLHDKLKKVFLGHLSKENNYEELAYETVRLEIDEGDCPYGASDFSISVAGRDHMSEIVYL